MNVIFGMVMLILGVVNAISPETGWRMSEGWKYKDVEPSEAALLWGRIGGIVCIIIGFVIIFRS